MSTDREDLVIVEAPWEGPAPSSPPKEVVYRIQARYNIAVVDGVSFPRPGVIRVEGRSPTA